MDSDDSVFTLSLIRKVGLLRGRHVMVEGFTTSVYIQEVSLSVLLDLSSSGGDDGIST